MIELGAPPQTLLRLQQKSQQLCSAIEITTTTRPWVWLFGLSVVYFVSTIRSAMAKPLWFDELFTYYISSLSGFADIIGAAKFDGNPPGIYLVTHLSHTLFGKGDLATRAPEMLSFWVLCVCLFLFVRRHCGAPIALLAFVIPLAPTVSPFASAYQLAFEARPYALVLGLTGIALVSWQAATLKAERRMALLGLAFCVLAAACCHYYALIQVVFPLALGETSRSIARKRVDYPILVALSLSALPVIWLFPQINAASAIFQIVRNSPSFWAKPSIARLLGVYPHLLAGAVFSVLFAVAVLAAAQLLQKSTGALPKRLNGMPRHNLAAAIGFLLVPVLIFVLTTVRTGYFMDRYCVTAIVGVSLLICYVLSYAPFTASANQFICLYISLQVLLTLGLAVMRQPSKPTFNATRFMIADRDSLDLVISNPLVFLPIARYGSVGPISRAIYLSDLPTAYRQKDFMPEYSLSGARQFFPLRIENYNNFVETHDRFWLYYSGQSEIEWLPAKLRGDGNKLEFISQEANNILYLVTRQ